MASIYIHIPFCKKACHYCDFHFSTIFKNKEKMVFALAKEIVLRKNELQTENEALIIDTIYFGGGTPSTLEINEIDFLINSVFENYKVVENAEITLEANPDDLTLDKIVALSKTKINRLSIGIQSFFEDDLKLLNRAHNAQEAAACLAAATRYFSNISIDLIYGIPGLSNQKWIENIEKALSFQVGHISCYALTVEPKTALEHLIKKGKINQPSEDLANEQFYILEQKLIQSGYIHYELSNFGKENYFSKNNSGYWLGQKYIGIGPSAHSFDLETRGWNIANNTKYIASIENGIVPIEREVLSKTDLYNEYVMTGLRTIWGVSLSKIETRFGSEYLNYLIKNAEKYCQNEQLIIEQNTLKTTSKGKFFIDGIASDLFWID